MSRKTLNLVAVVVLLAAGGALAMPTQSLMAISRCQSGSRVCYCSGGCTAGHGECSCNTDL